jgi:hypothetical protein
MNTDEDHTLITQQPLKKKKKEDLEIERREKEELNKKLFLLQKIKESEEKLKFEQEQRKNLIEMKKKEIERKERTINQMTETNKKLKSELEILQVEVQEKLDKMEFKEKNDIFENEKKKRYAPLEQLLKVKEKELQNSIDIVKTYKKEKEQLQQIIEDKVDMVQINSLNDQIKLAQEKIYDLEKEQKYLLKVKEEHKKCAFEQNKIQKEIDELKKQINELKQQNKEKAKTERIHLSMQTSQIMKDNININRKSPEEKELQIKNSLDEFWSKNKDKLMESDDENNSNENNNNNNLNDMKKKEDKKENILNIKKKIAEEIRNENLKIGKSNELLPKIPLFNQNEKKILLNILPEKEIEKFEKRYECIDNAKNNLKRKYALETKLLNKENKDLENKYEISLLQLKENEQKNKNLLIQINEQKKEVFSLQKKLEQCIKVLEEQKNKVRLKDEENKILVKELTELQLNYEKNPLNKIENKNEEEEK